MVLVFFFILLIILLFINITVYIDFHFYEKNKSLIKIGLSKHIAFTFKFAFILDLKQLEIKIIQLRKKKEDKELFNLKKPQKKKKRKKTPIDIRVFNIKKLDLRVSFGNSDAYNTAMVCGYASGLFDIAKHVYIAKNNKAIITSTITPCYNCPTFKMSFNCIISFKLANIISKFIKSKFKNK